jgi:hypothetical protein
LARLRRLDIAERRYRRRVTHSGVGPRTAIAPGIGPPPDGYRPLLTTALDVERLEFLLGG